MHRYEYTFNSEKLTQLRGQTSKAQMARNIGISPQLWDYYESGGCPSIPILARMLFYFRSTKVDISFEDLVITKAEKPVTSKG
jgi:transcriptional regulator with XRE-family HTH domain